MSRLVRERHLELPVSDGSVVSIRVVDVAGARHLRLSVGRDGARMSKPRWVPLRDALAFAHEKREWLEARLAEYACQPRLVQWPVLEPGRRGSLPLRGIAVPLRIAGASRPSLQHDDAGVQLSLPARGEDTLRRMAAGLFRSWLDTQMRSDVGALLAHYTPALGRAPTRMALRPLSSLWGSLSARDHLSLDLSLILAPPELLEYVVVHELAHLFERNHGPRFWARVASMLPDYRQRQRQLRVEGHAYKAALGALLDPPPASVDPD
jgi:predicted metal-dependent hydrolase